MSMLLKCAATLFVVFFTYLFGYYNGKDSEELKNARLEISALQTAVEKYQSEQDRLSNSLADIRVSESRARDESEWMRGQLSELEARAKSDADRERNRCLRLAAEGKELLDRAERAIKFCEENHK